MRLPPRQIDSDGFERASQRGEQPELWLPPGYKRARAVMPGEDPIETLTAPVELHRVYTRDDIRCCLCRTVKGVFELGSNLGWLQHLDLFACPDCLHKDLCSAKNCESVRRRQAGQTLEDVYPCPGTQAVAEAFWEERGEGREGFSESAQFCCVECGSVTGQRCAIGCRVMIAVGKSQVESPGAPDLPGESSLQGLSGSPRFVDAAQVPPDMTLRRARALMRAGQSGV